ncbi:hypothetical protein [Paraglaciecola agarilytica]|uniref:hypothetical protein n=1 Tax=Paraglaciecola chathamensis TaxID=368405 RepID=UPI0023557957|nr:hypothetical protein [Paraglaciecola agarilytica]
MTFAGAYGCGLWYGSIAIAVTPMNVLKNLALAVLIAILITYSLGYAASDLLDIRVQLDSDFVEPVTSLALLVIVGVVLVMIGFAVALSLMAAIGFTVFAVLGALVFAGLSSIWPVILGAIIIIWALKDKKSNDGYS